jgi:hypothetical protein
MLLRLRSRINVEFFGILLIIVSNIIWYRTKFILKVKGYDVGWFIKHFDDYPNLLTAIKFESDQMELERLIFQKKLMLSSWILFPLGVILIWSGAFMSGSS